MPHARMRCSSISAPSMRSAVTAAEIAIKQAAEAGRPWVLDPVFVERSHPRTAFAKALADQHPRALRLNRAEFAALTGAEWSEGGLRALCVGDRCRRGADRRDRPGNRRQATRAHRQRPSADEQSHRHGLRRAAVVAACLAVEPDAWRATVAALILFGIAGEIAGARATGPGSFAVAMLDAIYALDGNRLMKAARVAC